MTSVIKIFFTPFRNGTFGISLIMGGLNSRSEMKWKDNWCNLYSSDNLIIGSFTQTEASDKKEDCGLIAHCINILIHQTGYLGVREGHIFGPNSLFLGVDLYSNLSQTQT